MDQDTPGFEQLRELTDTLLAHLVAARAAQHQRNDIALFRAEAWDPVAQVVINDGAVYAVRNGQRVQLMQLQPQAFRSWTVELCRAHEHGAEAADSTLQGNGEQLQAVTPSLRGQLGGDQLVTDGEVVVQCLAKARHLSRALVEHDGLVDKVAFQFPADEMDFWSQQFEQLQSVRCRHTKLIDLAHGLIQLSRSLPKVRLGQAGKPASDAAHAGFAEG